MKKTLIKYPFLTREVEIYEQENGGMRKHILRILLIILQKHFSLDNNEVLEKFLNLGFDYYVWIL